MNVCFIVNTTKTQAIPVAVKAMKLLHDDEIHCFIEKSYASEQFLPYAEFLDTEQEALERSDIVITVGGDGTILHAVSRAGAIRRPILGINLGRMGFLATVEPNELEELHRLKTGAYFTQERSLLKAFWGDNEYLALNDVVIAKGFVSHTIQYEVFCDNTQVSSYRGDGIIIATPTGSTAYSLSSGGPILDARSQGFVVTPICPHSLHTPPMVFAPDRKIKILTSENDNCSVHFSTDGTNDIRLPANAEVHVSQAKEVISLITFGEADQFKMIDKKLKGR